MELDRLFRPRRIAVYGGAWADTVASECRRLGFAGELWRVHPSRGDCFRSTDDLPGVPDSVFLGIRREAVVEEIARLRAIGAGGVVVFASGFGERGDGDGHVAALDAAAGDMPYTGPNCYGFANFFDRVSLWPEQIMGAPVERGVAIIGQSGTICITLMYQRRALPVGYVVTLGNQQRVDAAQMIRFAAADERVSAIGLYLESVGDVDRFVDAVDTARMRGKPVALVKAGRSDRGRAAALTHTGALTGPDALHDALFARLGVARCESLAELVETLKLLHCHRPASSRRLALLGASGGDMAMACDLARDLDVDFARFPDPHRERLAATVSPGVCLDNPLDFQTGTWFDAQRMRAMFATVLDCDYALTAFMADPPDERLTDTRAWDAAIDALLEAAGASAPAALVSSLPENLTAFNRDKCLAAGVAPMQGLPEFLCAFAHSAATGSAWRNWRPPVVMPRENSEGVVLDEAASKQQLSRAGLTVPAGRVVAAHEAVAAAGEIGYPVALKALAPGLAHKTEAGAVALQLEDADSVRTAAGRLARMAERVLVERMVDDGVCELLVGVGRDPQFGAFLSVGSGGVRAEMWRDTASLLPPVSRDDVAAALDRLRCRPLLDGWRGAPPGDIDAAMDAIIALVDFALDPGAGILELEVNPLIVRPRGRGVVIADALLRINGNPT